VLQYSKVLKSRHEWKDKATKRADENRLYRKAKKRDVEKMAALKAKIIRLEQAVGNKKNQ
jgi:hypothetical protein